MTFTDTVYAALEQGMNIKLLLLATGLDKATFLDTLEWNKFTQGERKLIKQEINYWNTSTRPEQG